MKQKRYDEIMSNYCNLSSCIGVTELDEMKKILFTSTGEVKNPKQVAKISYLQKRKLERLENEAMDLVFQQIIK